MEPEEALTCSQEPATCPCPKPRPTNKIEDHFFSAVCDYLFNKFIATFHIWRPPSTATRGRAMP